MSRSGPLRLFVALAPPPDVARALLDLLPPSDPVAPYRATPPEQVHLTLQFIGDTPQRQLDDVIESVSRSCAGIPAFSLQCQALRTFPPGSTKQTPRLIAVQTDTPAPLLELHRRLAARLASPPRGKSAVDKDHFLPHLTLARFTKQGEPKPIDTPLDGPRFDVRQIALIQSVLLQTHAEHREVRLIELQR